MQTKQNSSHVTNNDLVEHSYIFFVDLIEK